jgi:hypothetical protein
MRFQSYIANCEWALNTNNFRDSQSLFSPLSTYILNSVSYSLLAELSDHAALCRPFFVTSVSLSLTITKNCCTVSGTVGDGGIVLVEKS